MKVNKSRNRFFILKIVFVTLLLIGCFSLAFISTLFLFIDGFSFLVLLGSISGLVGGYFSTRLMLKLNRGWMSKMIVEIKDGDIESSHIWEFTKEEWQAFISWKKAADRSDLKGSIIMTSIIAIVIFFAMVYSSFELIPLIGVSIGGGIAFGVLIGSLMYLGTVSQTKKMASQLEGKVTFTENAFLINDLLLFFNQIGTTLKKMKIAEHHDIGLLMHVIILTQAGTRKNEKEYTFPIPKTKVEEAERLVELYGFSSEHVLNEN
ncbi:MAG: hypothetical protein AB8B73_05670 [Ekhidna sp.]